MRRWVGDFIQSGRFVPWALGLIVLVLIALPEPIGGFLFANGFIIAAGALVGWGLMRFVQDIRKWGIGRALWDYVVLPLVVVLVVAAGAGFVGAMSWLFGDRGAFDGAIETASDIVGFLFWFAMEPRIWVGLVIGIGIHLAGERRRKRLQKSPDYMAEKRLLRYILWYQLKIWSAWPTSTSPFHHEWPVPPSGDTSPLSDRQMDAYMDLRGQRPSLWRRIKRLFRRK